MVRNIGLGAPWNLEPCLELSINRGQAVTADHLQCNTVECNILQYSQMQYSARQPSATRCSARQCNALTAE